MSLLTSSSSQKHEPLPSLPPSPSPTEEDLSGAAAWSDREDETHGSQLHIDDHTRGWKGKGKAPLSGKAGYASIEDNSGVKSPDLHDEYPPSRDEEEESRKIAENLKRWEMAERERRKAAREGAAVNTPSSVVGDVSYRASLLWAGRKSNRASRGRLGIHRALSTQETDDNVPLENIEGDRSAPPSIPASPTPSDPEERKKQLPLDNPFEDPSSFNAVNRSHRSAVMEPSSLPPTPAAQAEKRSSQNGVSERPLLQVSSSFSKPLSPPLPLDIPPPRTPPPRTATPHANRPPEPGPRPVVREMPQDDEQRQESRWWTEWLCGCGEGPDRGGDYQAGRTNPLE